MKTQKTLINEALEKKSIDLKTVCDNLDLNYQSIKSMINRDKFGTKTAIKLCTYLDIDFKDFQFAPVGKARKTKNDR